ncbi:MAG TPA: hypothetical protein VFE84_03040, partial [Patescibacteria group bacterium]|nr:hypothetical protein [Patescibacteria group bacterium]
MTPSQRFLLRLSIGAALASFGIPGPGSFAKDLPGYDELDKVSRHMAFTPRASEQALIRTGTLVQSDERLGVPTFVWAARSSPAAGMSLVKGIPREEQVARRHLGDYASLYRLGPDDVAGAVAASIHNTGSGAVIVTFQQRVGGIEVFRDEMKIIMDQDLDLVAISGYLPGLGIAGPAAGRQGFALDAGEAIAAALKDYLGPGGQFIAGSDLVRTGAKPGGYDDFDLSAAAQAQTSLRLTEPARIRQVLFHLPETL